MRVELCREYRFESAHYLPQVPESHKCRRLHGHSYRVEVVVAGQVDEHSGFLLDFFDLDRAAEPVIALLDHCTLNHVEGLANPTCERLCAWVWGRLHQALPGLAAVTIWETVDSRCTYRGEG